MNNRTAIYFIFFLRKIEVPRIQPAITYLEFTIEALEQFVKCFQS